MTYLSGKSKKRKQSIQYMLYILFFIVIIFWVTFKTTSYSLLEPIVLGYVSLKKDFNNVPNFFSTYTTSHKTLVEKNKALEITIENLENEIAERDGKLKEFGLITSDTLGDASLSTLVLYPLMTDITKIYSTILLSKGFKDGVEKDAYVYVRGLQPVCIIRSVDTSTSLCELLSAGGIVTDAVIESSSSTSIALTLVGRGGGTFVGDIARDTPVVIGDKVFLKSDQSMTLGTVVDVLHNNQDTSWHVFVRGAYNPITSSIFYLHKK
jgi:cell shape-determining protein MreC